MSHPAPLHLVARTFALKTPFRVSHGTSDTRTNLWIRLGEGVGEAALVPYYPYTREQLEASLRALDVQALLAAPSLQDALEAIAHLPAPARCAVDLALHDAWGKHLGVPLHAAWGLNPSRIPPSSYTLGIPPDLATSRDRVSALAHLPVLKLKLGSGDVAFDLAVVREAKALTSAQIGVDANSAWSVDEAVELIPHLADLGVIYVEQPLAKADHSQWHRLRERLPNGLPPLIADESVQSVRDIVALYGAADGINMKIAKAGGLAGGRRWIEAARGLGMCVLVGCMVESRIAISGAAHLAPLADFCDLDGMVLIREDGLEEGVRWTNGQLTYATLPGLGVTWPSN